MPQDQGCKGEAKDPRLYAAVEEHLRVVTLSVIQGQALLQVRLGRAEFTQIELIPPPNQFFINSFEPGATTSCTVRPDRR